jgi:hypothetical protein
MYKKLPCPEIPITRLSHIKEPEKLDLVRFWIASMTKRPTKHLHIQAPIPDKPEHHECYRIKAELCWKVKNYIVRAPGVFLTETR